MKKILTLPNLVILGLPILFLIGFVISLNYSNKPLPTINFSNEPEYDHIYSKYAYISGSVINPGVYKIDNDTRIVDLVELAGGFSSDADSNIVSEQINLSKILEDEEHVFIPSTNISNKNNALGSSTPSTNNSLINLNAATLQQLISLPNIGESTAQKIINARPFNSIEDLLNVEGIGEKTFDSIKSLVTI